MSNAKFMTDLDGFTERAEKQLRKIALASALDLINDAQNPVAKQGGSMPVDTGNLRNSITMELNGGAVAKGNGKEPSGNDAILLTIGKFQVGDVIAINWTAPYARARHYKPENFGQGGGYWRDKAAAKWQTIVDKNAKAAR
jgi:hypothetical protein